MAEETAYLFPVVVEGNWGKTLSKSLKNKLLCYLQSPKRSGGGECKVCVEPGEEEQITVFFTHEEVRQRVLSMKNHELDLPDKKKLKLTISLPIETAATATVESDAMTKPNSNQGLVQTKAPQQPAWPKDAAGTLLTQDFSVMVETAAGEKIENEIVEMYFENKKRSGGGTIKSCVKDGEQFIITFEDKADAQEVLQRKNHMIKKIALRVRRYGQAAARDQPQMLASPVLLENVRETIQLCMLILLVENVSGLSEEDEDFSVEMIPARDAAVVTFLKPIDTDSFIKKFNEHRKAKQLDISAHALEVTKRILVENIPSDISRDFIDMHFESKKYGGGPVLDINYLPERHSALITFHDSKEVNTILERKHFFNNTRVQVYPYYESLGIALYGKEKPPVKLPVPTNIAIDPYQWQFLQRNPLLLEEISHEMLDCYCQIEWPSRHSPCPEITMHPLQALLEQNGSLAKTWNENVSSRLKQSLSKQKVVKFNVNAVVWEAIQNSAIKEDVFILPDIAKEIVVLIGPAEAVERAEQEMNVLRENAIKKLERERQTVMETLTVVAGKYTILCNCGLLDRICSKYPDLKIAYDSAKECITLSGVATEVFKLKSEILEMLYSMVQKTVGLHPNIFLFLQQVDNTQLSQLLFWARKINAFYELKQEAVLLIGRDPQDLLAAEDGIKNGLTYRCIALKDNSVIRKREWRELTDTLYKAHNCSSATVIIQELEDEIVIAGCSEEVASASRKLSDFVVSNAYIQEALKTKSAVVPIYVKQEKQNHWLDIRRRGVKIHFGTMKNCKLISLEGPQVEVLKGCEILQNIVSSLCTTCIVIERPGAKAFFKEQEHLYVTGAKERFNCLIRVQESNEDDENEGEEGHTPAEKARLYCEIKLKDGIVVTLHKGNLSCFPADVVVNAANGELKHIGGLAAVLSKAAGPQLQKECDDHVRIHGSLRPGCAVITGAGNLPCKQVIHAVGPRWDNSEKETCIRLLKKAVRESLCLADTCNHRSIAIPAISAGIFGFPLKECARSIVTAIKEVLEESSGDGCLKQICLVDSNEKTVQALSEALKEVLVDGSSPSKQTSVTITKNLTAESGPGYQELTTPEGLKIVLQIKGIEDATTDVIVNTVGRDLALASSPLSCALLAKAGAKLQAELTEQGRRTVVRDACVLKTKGYALGCSHVLHAVLPLWSQHSGCKILEGVIEECLKITEELSLNSITFPAIGTGNLDYPKYLVAKVMFDELFRFSQKKNPRSLQEVHLVLHQSNVNTIKVFTDELNSRLNISQSSPSGSRTVPESSQQQEQTFPGQISSPVFGVYEMQLGPVTLHVKYGDITQETTDAIVNITNETFNLRNGVSKAILNGAGPEMAKECEQLASHTRQKLICTKGGNLNCKNVIHLVADSDTKAQVFRALKECEHRKFSSVAFPAIGTGNARRDPVIVADDMIDAIIDFASKTSAPVVKHIKIIIFQTFLLDIFHTSMQRKEVASGRFGTQMLKKIFHKITGYFIPKKPAEELKSDLLLETVVEPTIFQICGESKKNVEDTASWLKSLILNGQSENSFIDECISHFGESEYKRLHDIQRKLHIAIKLKWEAPSPSLHIQGVTKDVLKASTEIQTMIKRIQQGKEEQSRADLLSNLVEWKYEDNGEFKAFDPLANMHIEYAVQAQTQHEITINNKRYRVDSSNMCAVGDQGARISLQRIPKAEGKWSKPSFIHLSSSLLLIGMHMQSFP
uniref:Poly [ADP-ribose] polymerase n=1 Tax=Varanus komodoensis TaxID=61221 RepID=A0A8D2IST3_VARKO